MQNMSIDHKHKSSILNTYQQMIQSQYSIFKNNSSTHQQLTNLNCIQMHKLFDAENPKSNQDS